MDKEIYDDDIRCVTRRHNRALRSVNRQLRRARERDKQETDEIVAALFDAPTEAETELWRLWHEGGFQPPTGPEDYREIVDVALRALKACRTAGEPAESV